MKKFITAFALAIGLIASAMPASADPWYGQGSFANSVAAPGLAMGGLVALGAYLIINKDAKPGSLKASVPMDPDVYRQHALAPRGGASGAAYAYGFVNTGSSVAAVK